MVLTSSTQRNGHRPRHNFSPEYCRQKKKNEAHSFRSWGFFKSQPRCYTELMQYGRSPHVPIHKCCMLTSPEDPRSPEVVCVVEGPLSWISSSAAAMNRREASTGMALSVLITFCQNVSLR